jgi:hypothetical protein
VQLPDPPSSLGRRSLPCLGPRSNAPSMQAPKRQSQNGHIRIFDWKSIRVTCDRGKFSLFSYKA